MVSHTYLVGIYLSIYLGVYLYVFGPLGVNFFEPPKSSPNDAKRWPSRTLGTWRIQKCPD